MEALLSEPYRGFLPHVVAEDAQMEGRCCKAQNLSLWLLFLGSKNTLGITTPSSTYLRAHIMHQVCLFNCCHGPLQEAEERIARVQMIRIEIHAQCHVQSPRSS